MNSVKIPGFTAEVSLGKPRGHYQTRISLNSVSGGSVQAQAACFCSEPDIKRVCTSPGHCYNEKVCLQWFCPKGQSVDDDDLAGFFGLTPN
jgi:hypothetical protein